MSRTSDIFGQGTTDQLGRDAIVSKPVKGVAEYYGPPIRGNQQGQLSQHATFTVGRKILERRSGPLPQRTNPKSYDTPENQLVPEDPRTSRVCLNAAVTSGKTAADRLDFERSLLPDLRCPTHTDPRMGQMTKGMSVRYTSTC
jgi:hypothetical protein